MPPELDGVPALECPKCGGHIRLSSHLSQPATSPAPVPAAEKPPQAPRHEPRSPIRTAPEPATPVQARKRLEDTGDSSFWADFRTFFRSRDVLRVTVGLAALGLVALVLHLVGFFSPQGAEPDTIDRYTRQIEIPDAVHEEPVIAKSVGSKLLNGAVVVLTQFHSATTPKEKLKWVLRPDKVAPQLSAYYSKPMPEEQRLNQARSEIAGFTAPGQIGVDDIQRGIVALVKKNKDESVAPLGQLTMIAFFKHTPDGMKLDWESYVQAKDGTLRDFLRDSQRAPETFRVRLTRAHYFGHGDQPPNTVCVTLDDLVPLEHQPYLFIPEDTELADEVKRRLAWSENVLDSTSYATVRLAWKPGVRDPQSKVLAIDELICWELLGVGTEAAEAQR